MATSICKRFPMFTNYTSSNHKTRFFIFCIKKEICSKAKMKVLNVAEKNDVAKNVSAFLSDGNVSKRESLSKFSKIFEFECEVFGRNSRMIMTSVMGHLIDYDFVAQYRKWSDINPVSLFNAPIVKFFSKENERIKKTLQEEVKFCNSLIIWTDCDREGENIGFEIIEVCKEVKPNINIYRAKFSEITYESVKRALQNLETPNTLVNEAVLVRRELDLRIGAAFTRFQTQQLSRSFPTALGKQIVSYGSCQFPTLGFVVERFKAISDFIPEKFWKVNAKHTINGMTIDFKWKRDRLFDKVACEVLYDKCTECNTAEVEDVISKSKTKWRPKPLDTVELQKLVSKKLGITAKETMRIAEKLYTMGLISYPRTETNIFSGLDLRVLVQGQTEDPYWGGFAEKVLRDGPNPFQGKKTDNAHPPIHPVRYSNTLINNEKKIYEFIVRHFLACLSKNAEGLETVVSLDIAGEKFETKGLMVTSKNYLEVYPYDRWTDKEIPVYRKGNTFTPEIEMNEGETTPPDLLTEADLIALMEKHGIGTDATHAEHIENIKARLYVGLKDSKYFVPRTLGMGLVEGYNGMGYAMAKPELRAELETDLKKICENQKSPDEVLSQQISNYKEIYESVQRKVNILIETIQFYIQVEPVKFSGINEHSVEVVTKCPECDSNLVLKKKKNSDKFLSCANFPRCRHSVWFPSIVKNVELTSDTCPSCDPKTYLLNFKFKEGSFYLPNYVGCILCDETLLGILNCDKKSRRNSHVSSTPGSSSMSFTEPSELHENDDSGISCSDGTSSFSKTPNPPNCHCGIPALRLLVKKSGHNFGRAFYKCSSKYSSKCDFFLWEGEENNAIKTRTNTKNKSHFSGNHNAEEPLHCYCGLPSVRRIVMKDGPNKGKEFNTCSKETDGCKFFKWIENSQDNMRTPNTSFETFNLFRRDKMSSRSEVTKKPVKHFKMVCRICGQESHNEKTCPKNATRRKYYKS